MTMSSTAAVAGERRCYRAQVQRQAAQRAVRDVHRDDAAAGEQEGEDVAEVELVVDRREQQDESVSANIQPARVGRM